MKSRHAPTAPARAPIAPLHRGPQAIAPSTLSGPVVHAPNAALLIDFDNVTMGIRSDLQTELRNLLSSDIVHGKVAVQRAYADWRRYPQYIVPLSEASIDLIFAPAYGSSKKNATDIRLAIDAMELVFTRPEIGTIILLSGDSDFSSLVIKLKEYGKYIIGVGIRESSSDLLVQNCDVCRLLNALAGLVKSGEEETTKHDPWELVTVAINRMQHGGDVMRSDRLKQVMQEIDNTFDEGNLGIAKFSKFCLEAAQKGLLKVTKLENGQLEVAPPEAGPRASETRERVAGGAKGKARTEVAEDGAERPGRGRRGRRGGRGRKRGDRAEHAGPATESSEPAAEIVAEEDSGAAGDASAGAGPLAASPGALPGVPPVVLPAALPAVPPAAPHVGRAAGRRTPHEAARAHADASVGVAGLRLTRDEAFALVRDAVAALVSGEDAVPSEQVRRKAFALLGRDSESLSERNFTRILRDAHDADVVDLRKRGDRYEVAAATSAPSVSAQLEVSEAAHKAESDRAKAALTPLAPRGMGPRSAPSRGGRGGIAAKAALPPADLLLVGVVDDEAASVAGDDASDDLPARKSRRSRKEDAPEGGTDDETDGSKRPRVSRAKKAAASG